ncbi:MAG: PAS domain S-box protein [Salinivirgaceae bacterium]|nr:PAS domain S-box protein [Salinivirgaceae bacterium]
MVAFKDNSSNIHKSILNSIGEAVFIHNAKTGIIEDVNEAMLNMYGFEKNEVVGNNVGYISAEDEGYTGEKAFDKIQSVLKGNIELFEWKARRKDKSTFWAEVSLKLTKYSGKEWIIAVVRDISDKKENEMRVLHFSKFQKILADLSTTFISLPIEEFNTSIDNALELLGNNFLSDRAYIFIYNDDYSKMSNTHEWCNLNITAFKNKLQNIPSNLFQWNHNQLIKGEIICVPDVSQMGQDAKVEKEEFEKEGIQSLIIVPFLHNKQIVGFIGIDYVNRKNAFQEEDEYALKAFGNIIGQALVRKRNEESIKRAKLKAEESDKLKSAFLSNMSHEIRTPMNGIVGFAELLTDTKLPEKERLNYVKIINESSHQLLSIINDIIDISKIEANLITLNLEHFNLIQEIQNIINFFTPIAQNKGLELSFSHEMLKSTKGLLLDKSKLNQIFNNLISNAIKYTESGFIKVHLLVDRNSMVFKIKDSGIGIDKNNQESIFKRFVREDNEYTTKTGGNGLGLAITKGYIDKMGGKITVTSEKNVGSEFAFFIPTLFE